MKLGKYFSLSEMERTGTRAINKADEKALVNLTRIVALVLDPLRIDSGRLRITSGYRSTVVNKLVGGVSTSRHKLGLAVDIQSSIVTPTELAERIYFLKLPIDKVIVEFDSWIHIQIAPAGNTLRNQFLAAEKVGEETQYQELSFES